MKLEALGWDLVSEAMFTVEAQPVLLPPIATVKDWLVVDSSTVKLQDELLVEYPATAMTPRSRSTRRTRSAAAT